MKTKWIGLAILAVVIAAAAGYAVFSANAQVLELNGYLGGEKIGLLEDAEVQEIFRSRYRLSLDYARAGSLEMITADQTGMNYLFPSNQTALELYEQVQGAPYRSEIVLNTPIVLYTRAQVAEALAEQGLPFAKDKKAALELLRAPGWSEELAQLLPIRRRLECGEVLELCAPILPKLSPVPEDGWLSFCYR